MKLRIAVPALALVMLAGSACSVLGGPTSGSGGGSTPNYPIGTSLEGFASELTGPTSMPPGMNDWSCKPSSAHPYPVILVHGTFANEALSWQALSPMLADAGYCVYGLNYGENSMTLGHFFGLASVESSAQQLSDFVNKVLQSTGASKVDMVGHSQGGMMPRYYIKNLGGASKVNMLVGIAPSNHGSTADGLTSVLQFFQQFGFSLSDVGCDACTEQEQGSTFLQNLNSGGDTVSGPKYVVIESKYDEVITPYTNAFLSGPNVQNITLQNQCSTDYSEHISIIYDPVVLQDVMNALGADSSSFQPKCSVVLPLVGGVTG